MDSCIITKHNMLTYLIILQRPLSISTNKDNPYVIIMDTIFLSCRVVWRYWAWNIIYIYMHEVYMLIYNDNKIKHTYVIILQRSLYISANKDNLFVIIIKLSCGMVDIEHTLMYIYIYTFFKHIHRQIYNKWIYTYQQNTAHLLI